MSHSTAKYNGILFITALMWGTAFVFQREGALSLGPFLFNGIRCLLATLTVAPLIIWPGCRKKNRSQKLFSAKMWMLGTIIGSCLFLALTFQQAGLAFTTAGKAGFITEMGIVFVPLLALFLGERPRPNTWVGLTLVLCGLYFLTFSGIDGFNKGDLLEIAGAFMWSVQIMIIDRTAKGNNPFVLSFIQFLVCSLLCLFFGSLFETFAPEKIMSAWVALLYTGIISSGIAFTLQIIAQQKTPAIYVTMILSLEAVFAAVLGSIFLGEIMGALTVFGCVMMLAGILFAQINIFQWLFRRKVYLSHKTDDAKE